MITKADITDAMVLDFLRELNVHISKTELAVAYNVVLKHIEVAEQEGTPSDTF